MSQNYVLKDRSRDADSKKERSNMIRDPRQRTKTKSSIINAHGSYNAHLIKPNSKNKNQVVTFNDDDVLQRAIKSESRKTASLRSKKSKKAKAV